MHPAGPDSQGQGPIPVPPGRPPGLRMRNIGRTLFWAGAPLVVIAVVVGVIVAVMSFTRVADTASDSTPVSGPTEVTLEEGDRLMFYVPGVANNPNEDSDSTSYSPLADANCSVTGPDPQDMSGSHTSSSTMNGETYVSDGGFEARAAGDYTVTCAPTPDVDVVVAPPVNVGGILGGIGGILLTVFGTITFGIVTIGGLILWLTGRSTLKRHGAL